MSRVVVIIIAHKENLNWFEKIGLRQCVRILGKHPISIICPRGLDVSEYKKVGSNIKFDFEDPAFFSSFEASNYFKTIPFIYRKYRDYEFILFCELDSFVFSDKLDYWCDRGYDYVGAPWFEGYGKPISDKMCGVGNGGVSLRKVESHLKGSRRLSLAYSWVELIDAYRRHRLRAKLVKFPLLLLKLMGLQKNSYHVFDDYSGNDDGYWGLHINRKFSWYKVAPAEEALKFSMDVKPELLFKMNNNNLPFACHAWYKNNPKFWSPFIEKAGYELPEL